MPNFKIDEWLDPPLPSTRDTIDMLRLESAKKERGLNRIHKKRMRIVDFFIYGIAFAFLIFEIILSFKPWN